MSNFFPPGREVASGKFGEELKAAAEAAATSTTYPEFPAGRSCAFCLIPFGDKEAKKCAACSRRVYCSRECQAADWRAPKEGKPANCLSTKAQVYGQGHKNWCSIPCGEEGLDWSLKLVDGRPSLVALRDIPPLYRILVEGYQNQDELGYMDHPGFVTIARYATAIKAGNVKGRVYAKMKLQRVNGRGVFGFRSHFGNHSCDANAYLAWDPEFRVLILCSLKEIKRGEEICFQYEFLQFNDISRDVPNMKERAEELLGTLDHVCKEDCICKNQDLRRALLDLWAARDSLQHHRARERFEDAEEIAETLPQLAERARLPPQYLSFIDEMRLELQCSRGLPASQALPYVRKVVEFREKVWHPKNKKNVLKWIEMEQFFLQNGETLLKTKAV